MTVKDRLLEEIKALQEQVAKMNDGPEIMDAEMIDSEETEAITAGVFDSEGEEDAAITVEELSPEAKEYVKNTMEILEDLRKDLEESRQICRRDMYENSKKAYDMGGYDSEKAFVEKVIKKKHFEDFAIADGFNLENPSEAILPQRKVVLDEIASKSPERNMFDFDVEYHSLMAANALSGFGPVGELVGMGVGSLFGAVSGAVDAMKLHNGTL